MLKEVDPRSIVFHMQRRDFEKWVTFLGDNSLAMQIEELGKIQLPQNNLRSNLYDIVKKRCDKLKETQVTEIERKKVTIAKH
jgi:hypothetical protein